MKKAGGGIAALIIVIAAAYFILGGGGGGKGTSNNSANNSSNNSSQNVIPPAPTNNKHTVYKTSPPGPNDNVRVWGAIAIAPSGGWGLSTKMSSKQAAEHDAVEKCSQFNTGCELRVAFNNCAVYALAPDGTYGWATDASIDTAREKAVKECHKYTIDICGSYIELYADGSVQRSNVWAAVATADNIQCGVSWNYPIQDQAEKTAMNHCGKHGPNCKMRMSFHYCGPVARSEDGTLGWAHYPDMNQAVQAANKECTTQSTKPCKFLTQFCANGNLRK